MQKLVPSISVSVFRRYTFPPSFHTYHRFRLFNESADTCCHRFLSSAQEPTKTQIECGDKRFIAIAEKTQPLGISTEDLLTSINASPELLNNSAAQWESSFSSLSFHGFSPEDYLKMVTVFPYLLKIKRCDLEKKLNCWRASRMADKDIISILRLRPQFLNSSDIETSYRLEQLKSLGSLKMIADLLKNCPKLFYEDWEDVESKIEYVESNMGIERKFIWKSFTLNRSLMFLKTRHIFLERCGIYVNPKPKDDPQLCKNPPLRHIMDTEKEYFATKVAGLTLEEFEVFEDLFENEVQESDSEEYYSHSEADSE